MYRYITIRALGWGEAGVGSIQHHRIGGWRSCYLKGSWEHAPPMIGFYLALQDRILHHHTILYSRKILWGIKSDGLAV